MSNFYRVTASVDEQGFHIQDVKDAFGNEGQEFICVPNDLKIDFDSAECYIEAKDENDARKRFEDIVSLNARRYVYFYNIKEDDVQMVSIDTFELLKRKTKYHDGTIFGITWATGMKSIKRQAGKYICDRLDRLEELERNDK